MSSARGLLDKTKITFDCPECGRKVTQTIGEARRNRSTRCPGGHTINVEGSKLDRATRDFERDFDRRLDNLGR